MTEIRKRLDTLLKPYKKVYVERSQLNYMLLPVTKLELAAENVKTVNEITTLLYESGFSFIKRTKSGGISIKREDWDPNCFDVRGFGAGIEITICAGCSLRIQLGHVAVNDEGEKTTISGKQAFNRFVKELTKDDINLKSYAIDNGEVVNKQIASPRIKSYCANKDIDKAKIYEHVNHLDFHKAYMSGLYLSHPELQTTIQRLYDKRHEDPQIKSIFTNTIGYMHSKMIDWKYAGLARDAINYFNDLLDEVAYDLVKSGRRILAYNTDGIWYEGDVYHGKYEGEGLGQWSNDYVDCTARWKSDGAYEFICDGKYYAKIRGKTKLDNIKPDRAEWSWGDIFSLDAQTLKYKITKGYLITETEE